MTTTAHKQQGTKTFHPKTMAEMVKILYEYGAPIDKYGIETPLPLQALFEQIMDGTVVLSLKGGTLTKTMWVTSINIYFSDGKYLYKLHEGRQVFLDGASRTEIPSKKSRRLIEWSIAKKFKRKENSLKNAIHAIKQELGLPITPDRLINLVRKIYRRQSDRFLGIMNHVHALECDLYLTPQEFKRNGYLFDDKYLRTYLHWRPV
jgi:hypothetical protein